MFSLLAKIPAIALDRVTIIALTLATLFASGNSVSADSKSIWEFSPYQVKVWIAYDSMPHFTPALHQRIIQRVTESANVVDSSGWIVDVEHAPASLRYSIVNNLENLELSEEELSLSEIKSGDKLIFVGVKRNQDNGWEVVAREYDCRYEVWSFPARRRVITLSEIGEEVYSAVEHAFVPLARITSVQDKNLSALVRAGGLLIVESDDRSELVANVGSPAWISETAICSPMKRRSMRVKGKTRMMTTEVEWTYALVDTINAESAPILECSIFSAMRAPLGGSRGSRSDRVIRVVKPDGDATILRLTDRSKEPKPVAGYEIYSVLPNQSNSNLLGKTELDGSFVVKRNENPLHLLYVRSGSRVLARLPVVPGLQSSLTAQMFSDEVRLRAEGIVKGMQNNLLNLIALRQTLAIQIRSALEKKDTASAESLMTILATQPTDTDFKIRITEQQNTLTTDSPREKKKIDAMFNELSKLASQHITNKLNLDLTREINHVKGGGKLSDIRPKETDELEDAPDSNE